MKRKPYVMSEPFSNGLNWLFWFTADSDIQDFVMNLDCVIRNPHITTYHSQTLVCIDPRYDYEEAWLFIADELDSFVNRVELDDVWNVLGDDQ